MRINNNIMAMNTHRQYSVNNSNVAKSTERLSSGSKINRAGDDAAGLAISEKMRAQIRGLNMASKNSNDAISLVQTAEGALTETHSILQRMSELSVQSASDTNESGVDRSALNDEFQALKMEINDIASKTSFNNKNLLDGTFGASSYVRFSGDGLNAFDLDGAGGLNALGAVTNFGTVKAGSAGITNISFSGFTAQSDGNAQNYRVAFATASNRTTATLTSGTASDLSTLTQVASVSFAELGDGANNITLDFGQGRTISITTDASFDASASLASAVNLTFQTYGNSAKIQTGANEGDTLGIEISAMTTTALQIDSSKIDTQGDAATAITSVKAAINQVSTQRSKLGAIQNRLEHKINNLDTSAENLQAAESRIRDIDMAKQMTQFTTQNILVQAATAMLAQANSAPQNVLSLLKQ